MVGPTADYSTARFHAVSAILFGATSTHAVSFDA
jgi:hypothetical protein